MSLVKNLEKKKRSASSCETSSPGSSCPFLGNIGVFFFFWLFKKPHHLDDGRDNIKLK